MLTIDNNTVVFESTGKGTVIAEQELASCSYTFSISDTQNTCGTNFALAEESRIKSHAPSPRRLRR
ncbi:hypothetical protein O9992_09315 [Vibrio lentus]|nr:hypothetical protein [Vibrio lentus]